MRYRSQWYVARGPVSLWMAFGIHGPFLFIDRQREILIAKVSSQGQPLDAAAITLTMRVIAGTRDFIAARVT